MSDKLFSVRMRASLMGMHVSGAERIIREADIERTVSELIGRAMRHERGRPDSFTVSMDSLSGLEIKRLGALPITDLNSKGQDEGREFAVRELVRAGVSEEAARAGLRAITSGASPSGGNMRGAMVVDANTGSRLEPDQTSGIRARSVDYDEGFLPELEAALSGLGLNRTHLKEALALATKVAHAPGAVAELCVSDDPGYVTGYVASPGYGYVRITPVKEKGDPTGGRAFFVDSSRVKPDEYIRYLRDVPVLIKGPLRTTAGNV